MGIVVLAFGLGNDLVPAVALGAVVYVVALVALRAVPVEVGEATS